MKKKQHKSEALILLLDKFYAFSFNDYYNAYHDCASWEPKAFLGNWKEWTHWFWLLNPSCSPFLHHKKAAILKMTARWLSCFVDKGVEGCEHRSWIEWRLVVPPWSTHCAGVNWRQWAADCRPPSLSARGVNDRRRRACGLHTYKCNRTTQTMASQRAGWICGSRYPRLMLTWIIEARRRVWIIERLTCWPSREIYREQPERAWHCHECLSAKHRRVNIYWMWII